MSTHKDPEDKIWINRLKLAARSALPDFSPALHSRIMEALAQGRRIPSARIASHWSVLPMTLLWTTTAAIAVAATVFMIHVLVPARLAIVRHPSGMTIDISSVVPEPVHLLEQTINPLRRQYDDVSEQSLTAQAGQVTHYMVRRISLFGLRE